MSWIVFHVASGHVFFTGIGLLLVAALVSAAEAGLARRAMVWLFLLGLIGIAISSTPLPWWSAGLAVAALLAWLVGWYRKEWRSWSRWTLVASLLVCMAVELPWHFLPRLEPAQTRRLTVLGDSVTAGVGGSEKSTTWPVLLEEAGQVAVQDLSHMGETVGSALERLADGSPELDPLIVVELGGNDLMGSTSVAGFAEALDQLLAKLAMPGRQVVMFELPLPPFRQEYGRVQRRLATLHRVHLVPKRVFLGVIAGGGATLDSVHLSQAGHRQMAKTVWNLTRVALTGQ